MKMSVLKFLQISFPLSGMSPFLSIDLETGIQTCSSTLSARIVTFKSYKQENLIPLPCEEK